MNFERKASPAVGSIEIWVSCLLRTGVISSFLVVVAGTVLTFLTDRQLLDSSVTIHDVTNPAWEFPHHPETVLAAAVAGSGPGLIQTGLLLLLCTPVLRVALTLLVFLAKRDRAYVLLSAMVLTLLATSFVLGRAGG